MMENASRQQSILIRHVHTYPAYKNRLTCSWVKYRPHVRDGLDVEKAGGDMYFSSDITSYNDTYHTLLWYVTNPRFNSPVRYES